MSGVIRSIRELYQRYFPACQHDPDAPNNSMKFVRTAENWFDGDENDIYECRNCGHRVTVYVPR